MGPVMQSHKLLVMNNIHLVLLKNIYVKLRPIVKTFTFNMPRQMKQTFHIISVKSIGKRPAPNSIHEHRMTSVSVDLIGAFWWAMKRELYGIV